MNNQDKSIGRIYTELYSNVHADAEFREKILTMTETGIKRTKSSGKKSIRQEGLDPTGRPARCLE